MERTIYDERNKTALSWLRKRYPKTSPHDFPGYIADAVSSSLSRKLRQSFRTVAEYGDHPGTHVGVYYDDLTGAMVTTSTTLTRTKINLSFADKSPNYNKTLERVVDLIWPQA